MRNIDIAAPDREDARLSPLRRVGPISPAAMPHPIRVTVWNEFVHEKTKPEVARHYPAGLHRTIADALIRQLGDEVSVHTATLEEPEHGLTPAALAVTDVLYWW